MDSSKRKSKPNPKLKANPVSKILFWWMKEFLWTGYKRDLEQSDLYEPLKIDLSEKLGDDLERVWEEEQSRALQKGKSPSLLRAIFVTFWKQYIFSGILTFLVSMGSRVAQPLLLGKVIEYFTPNSTMAIEEAYMYGAGMILNVYLMVIMDHQYNLSAAAVGMRIRIACCSLIYRKVLKLSMVSSGKTTTGWLVNLLSNDVNRFDMVTLFLHFIWIAPLQVLLVTYCLWQYVGVAAFIGVAFIFLQTIPVQSYMSKLTSNLREKIAVKTDERVRLMNEIICGIQVIKMYAWEKPFANMVALVRRSEIDLVRSTSYLRGVYMSFMVFTERTSLFVTLLAYVLLGNIISSDKVYSMSQFYNVLNLSLAIFYPMALSTGAEAMVSVDRIQEFLMQEEITPRKAIPSTFTQNGMKSCSLGVTIKNGCAKWSSLDSQPTLSDVCLHVKPGALCAIIGPVGSGKSSLLQAVLGELPLETGSLQVDSDISYASQEPWLFVGSVRQNILFGQPYEKKRYQEVVKVCALERDLQLFPYGDKTIVGERGVSLSGGQRARINLARAVYRDANLYIMDDPLSAVDTHVGKHLFDECIGTYLATKTRILVTHQLQYLKEADMIVILNEGVVVNKGTFEEVLKSGLDFAKLLPSANEDEPEEDPPLIRKLHSRQISTITVNSIQDDVDVLDPEESEEFQTKGAVKWVTYWRYTRAGGNICFLSFVFFMLCFSQVTTNAVDFWLSFWSVEMDDLDEYVPSDSEDEYSENEKILLEKTRKGRSRNIIDSEEEVFGLHDSDDDDGGKKGDVVADSDLDAQEDGDDLPNVRAWGQSKRDFYHTDYVDQDYGGFDGKDAVAAEYEEQEARAIQQRLAEQLDEGDFSLDIFTKKPEEPSVVEGDEEVIKTDLRKLSKRQKLALLQKEAPEFSSLVQDFKDKMTELQERLAPVLNLIKEGKIPTSPAGNFVKTKYHLILNYCTNISFYLLLKARRISVQSHPVVRRLYQYRQLLKQLEPVDQEVMTSQIDTILKLVEDGALITPAVGNGQQDSTKAKSRKLLRLLSKSQTQNVDSEDIEAVHPPVKKSKLVEMEQDADLNSQPEEEGDVAEGKSVEEDEGDEKRAITYKMAKNRGLTPYRKKELRNPRVKHRIKYRKAKIRRKGQVREPRYEIQRYGGEISGIKTSVTRSTKIK